ncbi:MAG TPA: DUF6468 domain-containing protein [Xanthobacteraceae bacterium]|nr:DUF6468 domain-containing protein [Xanthobacteraceae bacterium]
MSANFYGLVIECLVAVLLLLTIGYCMILNRRLSRLRADEGSFKATIAELVAATDSAERAIAGLKMTVRDCDDSLGERLRRSEALRETLGQELSRGEQLLARIARIVAAASEARRPMVEPEANENSQPVKNETPTRRRASETVAAAQALASRARLRAGEAA